MYLLACNYSYAKSCLISILTYLLLPKLARMASHQQYPLCFYPFDMKIYIINTTIFLACPALKFVKVKIVV